MTRQDLQHIYSLFFYPILFSLFRFYFSSDFRQLFFQIPRRLVEHACQDSPPVHLISQASDLDIVGLLHPMGDPQVAVSGPRRMVAVLQQNAGKFICFTTVQG